MLFDWYLVVDGYLCRSLFGNQSRGVQTEAVSAGDLCDEVVFSEHLVEARFGGQLVQVPPRLVANSSEEFVTVAIESDKAHLPSVGFNPLHNVFDELVVGTFGIDESEDGVHPLLSLPLR